VAYRDLREFIRALEKAGELRRIAIEAPPVLEITALTDPVTRRRGPALLFERPKGSQVPSVPARSLAAQGGRPKARKARQLSPQAIRQWNRNGEQAGVRARHRAGGCRLR
jgi:hypothetical protein